MVACCPLDNAVTRIHRPKNNRRRFAELAGGASKLIRFASGNYGTQIQLIDGALSAPDRVSFSATGRAAALFSATTHSSIKCSPETDSTPTVAMHGPGRPIPVFV